MSQLFNSLPPAKQQAMLEGPAIAPPPGVVPNFANPPNSRHVGWIVCTLGPALCALAVVLRLYSRAVLTKRIMIEDYISVVALAVYGGFQYYVLRIVIYPGLYVHTWDIPLKALSGFLFDLYTGATIHGVVMMLLKAAILLDLLRIFSARGQRNFFFWTCHAFIWINVVFYTTCTFLELFACQPREKLWNKLLPGGHCLNSNALTLASSIINLPSDLIIFLLPQRTIWRLHLTRRKRLGISMIFAVAVFGCASAAIRLAYSVKLLQDRDILYHSAPVGVWIQAEFTAGFLILGIPALPKIFKHHPILQKWATLIKSWTGSSMSKDRTSARKQPSWYRPASHKKPPREDGWSELELTEHGSLVMQSMDDGTKVDSNDSHARYQETVAPVPRVHVRGL